MSQEDLYNLINNKQGLVSQHAFTSVILGFNKGSEGVDKTSLESIYQTGAGEHGMEKDRFLQHLSEFCSNGVVKRWVSAYLLVAEGDMGRELPVDETEAVFKCMSKDIEGVEEIFMDLEEPVNFATFMVLTCLVSSVNVNKINVMHEIFQTIGEGQQLTIPHYTIVRTCLGISEYLTEPTELNFPGFIKLISLAEPGKRSFLIDVRSSFKVFDRAGSGFITDKEVYNVFRALGQKLTPNQLQDMIKAIDINSDGMIDFTEFLQLMAGTTSELLVSDAREKLYLESLCGECQTNPATIDCTECHESYCKECCSSVHGKGRRKKHCNFINLKVCGECNIISAVWECKDCMEYYCGECNKSVHGRGRRIDHSHIQELDPEQFRAIEYDVSNGFGINVTHDLSISRFGRKDVLELSPDDLPVYLQETFEFVKDAISLCVERETMYIDTEYTDLELREAKECPTITTGIANYERYNENVQNDRERELKRLLRVGYEKVVGEVFMWKRAKQLYKQSFLFTKGNDLLADWPPAVPKPNWLVPNLVKFVPSVYDDAWLVLCLAVTATHIDLFKQLFAATDFSEHGIYVFQFHTTDPDEPMRPVVTDDYIPLQLVDSSLSPVFGQVEERNALWLVYLMKAYAKHRGSYSYLHGGSLPRAFVEMTGGVSTTERWGSKRISDESTALLWWKLSIATRLDILVTCFHIPNNVESSGVEVVDPEEEINWCEGEQVLLSYDLTPSMTTELLGTRLPGGLKLIKLRNLYGKSSVPGQWDWNGTSAKWNNKRMRKKLNNVRVSECMQWISVEDFAKHYNTLHTVTNYKDAPRVAFSTIDPCPMGKTACYAHQYLLTVTKRETEECRLVAGVLASDNFSVSELYNPPDFHDLEESSEEEFDDFRSGIKSHKSAFIASPGPADSKGFIIQVFVSQPNLKSLTDSPVLKKNIKVRVFRLSKKSIQTVELQQSSDTVLEEYTWPSYNMLDMTEKLIVDPSGNADKTKVLNTLEILQTFTVTNPGCYAVAVEQEVFSDDITYCLAISGQELAPADPTGLELSMEYAGTAIDPLLRNDKQFSDKSSQGASSFYRGSN